MFTKATTLVRASFVAKTPSDSMGSTASIWQRETLEFEQKHNSRYRYSKLKGKTPLQSLSAYRKELTFPGSERPPQYPIPKPEAGRYHFIRFIRSDARLDIFSEVFHVPSETIYEYVRATVDVANQKLILSLDNSVIDERQYLL
jgi:putative transposase